MRTSVARVLVCGCAVSEPNVSVNGWVLCPKCGEALARPEPSRPLKVKDLKALVAAIPQKYDEEIWYVNSNGYAEPEVHVDSRYGLSIS